MRSSLRRLVIFISCSVCVLADLELYPGINLDDQPETLEIGDDNLLPIYADRRSREYELDTVSQKYFGTSLEAFRNRLESKLKDLQRQIYNKQDTFKSKSLGPFKHGPEVVNYHKYHGFNHGSSHILGDARADNSDFTFREEEAEDPEDAIESNYGDRSLKDAGGDVYEKSEDRQESGSKFKFVTEDEPVKFAVPPSDARFYAKNPPEEPTSLQREVSQQQTPDTTDDDDDDEEEDEEQAEGKPNMDTMSTQQERISEVDVDEHDIDEEENPVKIVAVRPNIAETDTAGVYIIAVVAGISAAATVGLIAFGIGWYNLQKHVKNAADVEYPAYGITGPNKEISPTGDRRLAQSAQMYHYQHQKQQIIAMERAAGNERHGSVSEADSDEENEEGDYTVYECPGLAPTGEMEVKNPLFQDDPTPAQTPAMKGDEEDANQKK